MIRSSELSVAVGDGARLAATLSAPARAARAPVVLLIPGSGPIDRNGALPCGGPAPYLELAHALAALGIATIRYDKRGTGASTSPAERMRFADAVADAAAWIDAASAHAPAGMAVVGHSEGSLVAMLAIRRRPRSVSRFVSLCGLGRPAGAALVRQVARAAPAERDRFELACQAIARGERIHCEPAFEAVLRPEVQPYLRDWFGFDPACEIAALDVPALVVHGEADAQVELEDAYRLGEASGTRPLIVPRMTHMLATVDEREALAPELALALAGFTRNGYDGGRSSGRTRS